MVKLYITNVSIKQFNTWKDAKNDRGNANVKFAIGKTVRVRSSSE
jgi:hypothetical protein